jgi:anti-sigma factor RsiW
MDSCDYESRLTAYYDGELPPDERAEVEEHLHRCAACSEELARLRELSRILGTAPVPAAPQGLADRLRRGLRPTRELEIIRICRVASMAAAALLAVCVVSLWSSEPTAPAQVQAPPAWELAAVTLDADLVEAEWDEAFAQWVVDDLSRENGL